MEEYAHPATLDDLNVVVALVNEAHLEVADSKGGPLYLRREGRQKPIEVSIRATLEDDNKLVMLGALDTSTVGYATVTTEVLPDGAKIAEVGEIYVLPDARGVGVGEIMLDEIMTWARAHDCTHLEGSVLPGNRAGKNFFERAHMVTRILRVSTPLNP